MSFIKNIIRKENIGILIYLLLNLAFIAYVYMYFMPRKEAIVWSIISYSLYFLVVFSPLGEAVLRFIFGCRRIKREDQIEKLEPLFISTYKRMMKYDKHLPKNIRVYVKRDNLFMAKSIGLRTIVISDSLLYKNNKDIEAILAHEFAHISNMDPVWTILVSVGNIVIAGLIVITGICLKISGAIMKQIHPSLLLKTLKALFFFMVSFFGGVLIVISKLFLNVSQKYNEYRADAIVFNVGLGNELCHAIDTCIEKDQDNVFKRLFFNLQNSNERIHRLQNMGCNYKNYV